MCYSLVLICPHLSYSHGQYHVFMQVSDQMSPPQRNYYEIPVQSQYLLSLNGSLLHFIISQSICTA